MGEFKGVFSHSTRTNPRRPVIIFMVLCGVFVMYSAILGPVGRSTVSHPSNEEEAASARYVAKTAWQHTRLDNSLENKFVPKTWKTDYKIDTTLSSIAMEEWESNNADSDDQGDLRDNEQYQGSKTHIDLDYDKSLDYEDVEENQGGDYTDNKLEDYDNLDGEPDETESYYEDEQDAESLLDTNATGLDYQDSSSDDTKSNPKEDFHEERDLVTNGNSVDSVSNEDLTDVDYMEEAKDRDQMMNQEFNKDYKDSEPDDYSVENIPNKRENTEDDYGAEITQNTDNEDEKSIQGDVPFPDHAVTTADSDEVNDNAASGDKFNNGGNEEDYDVHVDADSTAASKANSHFPPNTDFFDAIASCKDLTCISQANLELEKPPNAYPFPSFLIAGWQKTATTSLFVHLRKHRELIGSNEKEPEYLTYTCDFNPPLKCPKNDSALWYLDEVLDRQEYLKSKGKRQVFEASTHIVRRGNTLAPALKESMPWLKIIMSLREPISRAASMTIHSYDKKGIGCLASNNTTLAKCLLYRSQISVTRPYIQGGPSTYTAAIKDWLELWPKEQLHIIQYEELTEPESEMAELRRVKNFLGVDPAQPSEKTLALHNARRFSIRPEGWPMLRWEYEKLIAMVKPDVEDLLDILEEYGLLRDRKTWLARWEDVWKDNLESCEPGSKGKCSILLS